MENQIKTEYFIWQILKIGLRRISYVLNFTLHLLMEITSLFKKKIIFIFKKHVYFILVWRWFFYNKNSNNLKKYYLKVFLCIKYLICLY